MKRSIIMLSPVLISVLLFASACSDETTAVPDKQDIYEPNDTFSTAVSMLEIDSVSAIIDSALDKDYFLINAEDNPHFLFIGSNDLELRVHIYDFQRFPVSEEETGFPGGTLSYTVGIDYPMGRFFLMVESANADGVGSYTIKLN